MLEFILDKSNYLLSNYHQPISRKPYPFQEKAFLALDKLKSNNPNGFASMLVLPTGAGKTYTAAHWIIKNYIDQGIKVLWVAHRSELLRQAAESFFMDTTKETLPTRTHYESYVISSEFGRSCNILNEDIIIASRQSICSYSNMEYFIEWAKKTELNNNQLLIVFDEAHHAAASSYRKIINTMKKYVPHVDILGLTATPFRTSKSEQGSLKKIFSTGTGITYKIDMNTLISLGILSNPHHIEIKTNIDMTNIFEIEELRKIARTDLSSLDEACLDKLNQNTNRNRLIVDTYLSNRKKFGRTIVFAVDVLNALALNGMFQAAGVKSDFVVSSLVKGMNRSASTQHNPEVIRKFKEGKLDVLVNVNIVTEGTDIPNIQSVFLARPTTSKILMTQMIGRGLRGEAAGGTKSTNIVYFVDDWKGMVDFVSPTELFEGDDKATQNSAANRKKNLKHYIEIAEINNYAAAMYQSRPSIILNYHNIIPYGVIKCSYMSLDSNEEDYEITKDLLVFDEAAEIYERILDDIPKLIPNGDITYKEDQIKKISLTLFFKYCESKSGTFIGISSELIGDIIRTYLDTQEMPKIQPIKNRVSLFDIARKVYDPSLDENGINELLDSIWKNDYKIRSWYEKDFYIGMMKVYFKRLKPVEVNAPEFKRPPKEKMDMGEIRKYYPSYYNELREYLILNMKRDEDGYYYSAIQDGDTPPYRSKYLKMFEMDHIIPISKGGLTIKENLQMILRSQNITKGCTLSSKQ